MSAECGAFVPNMPVGGVEVWKVMSPSPFQDVVLSCANAPEIACAALARAVEARTGTPPIRAGKATAPHPEHLTLSLDITRHTEHFLAGRLRWSLGTAPAISGPFLEVSVMDATVSNATFDRFVDSLLKVSDLPL